jgi:hypothetical protein
MGKPFRPLTFRAVFGGVSAAPVRLGSTVLFLARVDLLDTLRDEANDYV